jgi:hypothetical protein
MVSNATHCGSERPATIRSDAEPCFTLRAARRPTVRKAARMKRKTAIAKLGFYLEAAEGEPAIGVCPLQLKTYQRFRRQPSAKCTFQPRLLLKTVILSSSGIGAN